ncbi:unnamed protein product [Musa banksii]
MLFSQVDLKHSMQSIGSLCTHQAWVLFLYFHQKMMTLPLTKLSLNFSLCLKELGVDARHVKWSNSPHVCEHYSHHQTDYHSNVIELLGKAATIFSQRRLFNEGSENLRSSCNNISESICSLHETALSSNESLRRVDVSASDNICLPSTSNNLEVKVGSSLLDERKGNSFTLPSINPQGVLSQILFDVFVPKNVEGWDIKPVSLNVKQSIDSAHHHGPSNHMRCMRCSRLAILSDSWGMAAKAGRAMPLGVLLKRESTSEKIENPDFLYGQASQSKKGEDFTFLKAECQRVPGDGVTTFAVFAIFDGHNGSAAAIYAKENLLNNILYAIPSNLNRDEWLAALPRALVAGFVKTDKDFQTKAHSSGTTVTFVIIDGWVVTVASVGDSRCILESAAEGSIYCLSADHRLDVNEEEVERITASGGEVGRLNVVGGVEIGPLRCWPGGLCLSRSIGDMDVGEYIIPVPYVKQVKLSSSGGRLIISSDGVWDALTFEMAFNCSRGLPPDAAANQIVKEAVQVKGLRDDTTCIVVDMLPPEKLTPSVPPKKQGMGVFKNMFRRKSSESSSHSERGESPEPDVVEEIFEEGSASLAQRLEAEYPIRNMFKLFVCAVCQVEMKPGEGISVHADSSQPGNLHPWDGPFLCPSCQEKKEAMEGKRSSRDSSSRRSSESE